MNPTEILCTLKKDCSLKKQKTLEAIYEVCNDMLSKNSTDFSFANIARQGRHKGVPSAQSIRNSSGQMYRTLIEAFQKTGHSNRHQSKGVADWIESIKDHKLRFLVRSQEAENYRLRSLLKEIVPPNLEVRVDDRTPFSADNKLTDIERRALLYLISEEFRLQWGYTLGRHGDLLDNNGTKIFRPGTLDAIQKALRTL